MADPRNPTFDAAYVAREESMTGPLLVYAAYLLSIPTGGISTIIGLILAYVMKSDAGPAVFSHYAFQIRTFWLGLLAIPLGVLLIVLGVPLLLVGGIGVLPMIVGGLMAGGVTIWFYVRSIIGLVRAIEGRGYANYRTWLI